MRGHGKRVARRTSGGRRSPSGSRQRRREREHRRRIPHLDVAQASAAPVSTGAADNVTVYGV